MRSVLVFLLLATTVAACDSDIDCERPLSCVNGICACEAGFYFWQQGGLPHCSECHAGCACPGGFAACFGCSGGLYAPSTGATTCIACGGGTTSDLLVNSGCDPHNHEFQCSNQYGPVGQTTCRPDPPAEQVQLVMPNRNENTPGRALQMTLDPTARDIDNIPFLMQSY